ncbi:MAG TPA: preprotein translocase subunit SecA [Firmicutes bacterium]|nr:preprotein translocase subunit SecA [Bacillota bacterium]
MLALLRKLFDTNAKELKRLQGHVEIINGLEPEIQALSDAELQAKTGEFKERLARGAALNDILPEAFAVVREAARRTIGMRHFDVQLMGGIVLHEGRIAEMKTGEGKTLVATLPAYLNALTGKGVHIVTVNDYLARRDAEWMGEIYRFLGLTVGVIVHGLDFDERRRAYNADITYGTNNEFGFDYLRDNMVLYPEQMVQRELHYAIVDEVDSILIDEARTPLIISGPSEDAPEEYYRFARLVPQLKRDVHYTVDEKARTVALTEAGVARVEELLGIDNLFDDRHFQLNHYVIQALKAATLFKRDRDYIVKDGQVIIVDEFTGRLMFGRRYSDGLHQAIEAKEGVKIERESQTLATITFQNYFRMYEKLAGMTGTAKTEEEEFLKIYGMDVVVIPTHKPMIRIDYPDAVYRTEKAKFDAVVEEICRLHAQGRPVLVGTISIEKSEMLSRMLQQRGIPHSVLNAKYHEKEAEIIKQAGQKGAVTIATNMAGRGTDIVLGEGVAALGGLHIIGTERHESRRIDNQLRGRAGRQGDPGSSRFYVSLEDDLMRLFGSERVSAIMDRLGWDENEAIEHPQISKAIENAQKRLEAYHFDIRKQVLEYDNVINQQRETIYSQRRKVLERGDLRDNILDMLRRQVDFALELYADEKLPQEDWDLAGLSQRMSELTNQAVKVSPEELTGKTREELRQLLVTQVLAAYEEREQLIGKEQMRELERLILLRVMDSKWMEHLRSMDDLREGIGLRAYGQRDPLMEYKFEAYEMFQAMLQEMQHDVIQLLFRVRLVTEEQSRQQDRLRQAVTNRNGDGAAQKRVPVRRERKVGRNEPCPCGSGKKYKRCCGR